MLLARIRNVVARYCTLWCALAILVSLMQPLIASHFCRDGLENEGEFHIRAASISSLFESDDRLGAEADLETTIFVPTAASIDRPNALRHGIDGLMAAVRTLRPLVVPLARRVEAVESAPPEPVLAHSGAAPPSAIWRRKPPEAVPPSDKT